MYLKEIFFSEYPNKANNWEIKGLLLGSAGNLIVGRNATGKTRALNVISGLANLLCGFIAPGKLMSGHYKAIFDDNGRHLEYTLSIEDRKVQSEKFAIDGREYLTRGSGGEGEIFAEKIKGGIKIEFQTPEDELAAFVRRDSKQHSYIEPLYRWGFSVHHYQFGTLLGKNRFALMAKKGGIIPDGKDADLVVGVFQRAKREHQQTFTNMLIKDMEIIDYPLQKIDVGAPNTVSFDHPFEHDPVGLEAYEKDLTSVTDQVSMSQGMFRVLSLLILVNYLVCGNRPGCVIIDDIGEGLDYERSCLLIDLLRKKTEAGTIQLIVSTNDNFVMNSVPLEEWSVLKRNGGHIQVLNWQNSREAFEEFRFTGLSNFSFFEMDFATAESEKELKK